MFRDLLPYSETRATALPWASTLPNHWRIERAKSMMRAIDVRSVSGDEELLTVSSSRGVIPRASANVSMFKAESYVGHKLCWPNDLVINSLWAWGRGLGISQHHGIVSTAYGVYRHRNADLRPSYLHELVRSEPFQWELQVRSHGVWKSRLQMTDERWLDAPLLVPPAEEQAAIVKYLAHANARIDKAIAAKRRLIALLEEQTAIVSRQVLSGRSTEGIDLDPGDRVPWLGRIPAAWEALPLKRLAKLRSGAGFPVDRQGRMNQEFPFFRVSDMGYPGNEVFLDYCESTVSRDESAELGAVIFEPESICFPKVGGALLTNKRRILKRSSCLDNNLMGATFFGLEVEYAYEIMKLVDLSDVAKPGPVPAVGQGDVGRIVLPMPPQGVQHALVEALRASRQESARAADVASREIGLLQEFRTRLVADVVTGQVDVRAIAATLPDARESFDNTVPATDDVLEEALSEGED